MIKMVHQILKFCGHHASRIRIAYLFSFLKSVCANSQIMMGVLIVDRLLQGRADVWFCLRIALIMLVLLGLHAVFQNLADRFQSATGYRVFAEKRMEFGEHLRKLPMGYFTEGNMGKISSILSQDMVFIEENSMSVVADVISDLFSQLILTVFLFVLNPYLGMIALMVELMAVLISRFMIRSDMHSSRDRQSSIEEMTDAVIEYADGFAVTKAFNRTGESSAELRENMKNMTRANLDYEAHHMPFARLLQIIYGIGVTLILIMAIRLLSTGALSASRFVGVMLFLFNIFSPFKQLFELDTRFAIMNIALERIESVFLEKPIANLSAASKLADEKTHEIEFKDVRFAYDADGEEVLRDISFSADRGEMIALIGHSGSGKSTIANLLARFWDIKEGEILIKGRDIRNIPVADLMGQLSMVFQKVYLFRDTVYHNIAMGKTDATMEDVIEASKKARCYDFIMNLPYGFDTVIGEGGSSLSGGEAQRISIARCILKDTPIIILDEATASIDADNEKYIQEAMTELCKDKTTIVIAHRLNTIRNADKIILIDEGRITDSGTHEELLENCEAYRHLIELQNAEGWTSRKQAAS